MFLGATLVSSAKLVSPLPALMLPAWPSDPMLVPSPGVAVVVPLNAPALLQLSVLTTLVPVAALLMVGSSPSAAVVRNSAFPALSVPRSAVAVLVRGSLVLLELPEFVPTRQRFPVPTMLARLVVVLSVFALSVGWHRSEALLSAMLPLAAPHSLTNPPPHVVFPSLLDRHVLPTMMFD